MDISSSNHPYVGDLEQNFAYYDNLFENNFIPDSVPPTQCHLLKLGAWLPM